jgi:hypothetical protein
MLTSKLLEIDVMLLIDANYREKIIYYVKVFVFT